MAVSDQFRATRVRELCRQLKPVIGGQAERIWTAFVAESESGKAQIQDYLELLAAQHFHGSLEDQGPGLLPPSPTEAAGDLTLGTVTYNGKALHPFGLREKELTQHVGIFGRSGAGKTNLGFLLVQQLIQRGVPTLIVDWKRNYRDLLKLPGFDDVAVYTVGRAASPFSFNPLIPPPHTNPKTWLNKVISAVAHAYLLGDGVIYLLQEAIDQVYQQAGVYSGSVDRWPTFRDVLAFLKKRNTSGREAGWMSSALRAMSSLCFGEMDTLVNTGNGIIERILEQPVIMELDALTQSDKVFFANILLAWILEHRLSQPVREQLRHVTVLEEAHNLVSSSGMRAPLTGGEPILATFFRQIRELGEAMVVIDQQPSAITAPVLGNMFCKISFDLPHKADISAIGQSMLLEDDERSVLASLQVGEAVVRLQGRAAKPFKISVPLFSLNKGTVTDSDVTHHMMRLGLLSSRRQPAGRQISEVDHASLGSGSPGVLGENPTPPSSQNIETAFLADVHRYADSGIAERYKRLGLSVRQGQKLIAALLREGLIRAELQTTRQGKLRVIRLTEKGSLAVTELDDRSRQVA